MTPTPEQRRVANNAFAMADNYQTRHERLRWSHTLGANLAYWKWRSEFLEACLKRTRGVDTFDEITANMQVSTIGYIALGSSHVQAARSQFRL